MHIIGCTVAIVPLPLRVTGLSKRYVNHVVLESIAFELESGEALALLGPNGAGKSTLIGCICGTVIPDAGSVEIAGHLLARAPIPARRSLRYLAQEVEFPPGLTGRELLEFHAEVFEARAGIDAAITLAGIGDAIELLASTYSVGMRRRLAIAALSLGEAALYVLDEPFAGVDADSRARLLDWLMQRKAAGSALLLAAHAQDQDALEQLGARELVLES